MSTRKKRIESEAAALWRQLYHEPPPTLDASEMLDQMLSRLPTPSYDRLNSPFLRRSDMSWPKRSAR
ncbi:hypothetical protein LJR225_003538 [Phenylobacterium sp. LjRoot225]|uniref:hypothetical protein n=1 Tax=Phenylobacterium sp. LjRoot225 TaxID=3342285 RepID=UPI003ED0A61B